MRLSKPVIFAVIFCLGILVYAFSLPNEMFWDDVNFILQNNFIKDSGLWPHWFSENVVAGSNHVSNYWRPLILAVFSIEWHLWGNWVVGWHAVNALVHIVDALLVYRLLVTLGARDGLSFVCALVFLLHPLQTEAVVYVNSLGDPLATAFVLASVLFYIQFRRHGRMIDQMSTIAMVVLGLMSKETAFCAPFIIAVSEFLFFQSGSAGLRVRRGFKFIAPLLVVAGIYFALRATVLNFDNTFNLHPVANVFTEHISIRVFTFFKTLVVYVGLLLWPVGLHVERTMALPKTLWEWQVFLGFGLLCGSLIAIVRTWRTRPLIAFGLLWFYIALAPTSNILIPINAFLYEHWLYMPLIGLGCVLAGLGQMKLWLSSLAWAKVACITLAIWAVLSIYRITQWRYEEQFYFQTLTYSPQDVRVLNNLGVLYDNRKDLAQAKLYFERSIKANPLEPGAYYNLGWIEYETGEQDLALGHFEEAHRRDPSYRLVYRPLVYLYATYNQQAKARALLPDALRFYPDDPQLKQIADWLGKELPL